MKKGVKFFLVTGLVICAAVLVGPVLFPNSGGYVRATCQSDLSGQMRFVRGVFDVMVTYSVYEAETNSCRYTLVLNEVLKAWEPITLQETHVSERLDYPPCIDTKERFKHRCELPHSQYLLFTVDGTNSSLREEITLHHRYNYFQPIEKKSEVKAFLKRHPEEEK